MALRVQHHIARFQISVDYLGLMELLDGQKNLGHKLLGLFLGQLALLFD